MHFLFNQHKKCKLQFFSVSPKSIFTNIHIFQQWYNAHHSGYFCLHKFSQVCLMMLVLEVAALAHFPPPEISFISYSWQPFDPLRISPSDSCFKNVIYLQYGSGCYLILAMQSIVKQKTPQCNCLFIFCSRPQVFTDRHTKVKLLWELIPAKKQNKKKSSLFHNLCQNYFYTFYVCILRKLKSKTEELKKNWRRIEEDLRKNWRRTGRIEEKLKKNWRRTEEDLRKNWRRTEEELRKTWGRTEEELEELKKNWRRTEEELKKTWGRTEEELKKNWRKTEEELKKNWRRTEKELKKNWRKTEKELKKNWKRTKEEGVVYWYGRCPSVDRGEPDLPLTIFIQKQI